MVPTLVGICESHKLLMRRFSSTNLMAVELEQLLVTIMSRYLPCMSCFDPPFCELLFTAIYTSMAVNFVRLIRQVNIELK